LTSGPKKVPLYTARGYPQHFRHLFGGPLVYMTKNENLPLACRQFLKGSPNTSLRFSAENHFFRGPARIWIIRFLIFFIGPMPEFPPSGTSPITTCVDANPYEPWSPHHELTLVQVLKLLIYLQENLLSDLFGIVVIGHHDRKGL